MRRSRPSSQAHSGDVPTMGTDRAPCALQSAVVSAVAIASCSSWSGMEAPLETTAAADRWDSAPQGSPTEEVTKHVARDRHDRHSS